MFLIVGLGNPGTEYAGTRHNIGFEVLDEIGRELGVAFRVSPANALVADYHGPASRIVLAKPQTFVNQSGDSVRALADWFNLSPSDILVVHDDIDIPFGEVRVKQGGGSGGHRGLESVTERLNAEHFHRVRVGVGRPPGKKDPAEYVLEPFSAAERKEMDVVVREAAEAVLSLAPSTEE